MTFPTNRLKVTVMKVVNLCKRKKIIIKIHYRRPAGILSRYTFYEL